MSAATILYAFLGVAVLAVLMLCALVLFAGDRLDHVFPLDDDELDGVGTNGFQNQIDLERARRADAWGK